MRTPTGFAIAKHLTRFRRGSLLRGSYRLSLVPLTKPVRSCKGLTDTSGTRLSPLALHHAGGVGNAPVQFALMVILVARSILLRMPYRITDHKTTTKTNLVGFKHIFKRSAT